MEKHFALSYCHTLQARTEILLSSLSALARVAGLLKARQDIVCLRSFTSRTAERDVTHTDGSSRCVRALTTSVFLVLACKNFHHCCLATLLALRVNLARDTTVSLNLRMLSHKYSSEIVQR